MTVEPIDLSDRGLFKIGRLAFSDTWYPIAHAPAVGKKPIQRMLHETPIVLWRDAANNVRAMEDRCLHRRAPLSAGKIIKGELQCAYHGWTYNGDGRLTKIPPMGDDYKPPECGVITYPIVVRYGHVWLWWGDASRADPKLIPFIPFIPEDGQAEVQGTQFYDVPQELLIENILDLTHIDFIHGGLLGDPKGGREDISLESTDETVTSFRTTSGRPPPAALAPFFGFPKEQEIYNVTRLFVRSGCAIATITYSPPGYGLFLFITNTPEGPNRIRQDNSQVMIGPWWWKKMLPASVGPIQKQDHAILKLQNPRYQEADDRLDMSSPVDAPTLRYRAVRRALAKRQAQGDYSYTDGWQGRDSAEVLRAKR